MIESEGFVVTTGGVDRLNRFKITKYEGDSRTGAASRRKYMIPTLNLKCKLIWQIWGDKKFLSSICRK